MADRLRGIACLALLLGSGCDSDVQLFVDLKTDLRPGLEFTSVESLVVNAEGALIRRAVVPVTRAEDFLGGRRIVEVVDLAPGDLMVTVRLLDPLGELVADRRTLVQVRQSTAITVLVTRDCAGITCPQPDGARTHTECFGGRCVTPECAAGDASACPDPVCERDDECASRVACAPRRCERGVCYAVADDAACRVGEWCSPEEGCRALPLADAGVPDAGGCVPGLACTTERVCELGVTECVGGASVCAPREAAPAGTACRAASGECDVAETCDGVSLTCPADAFAAAGASCAAGICDGLGGCAPCTEGAPCSTGNPCERGAIACGAGGASCEAAGPAAAGTPCRAAADACDVAEVCDGASTTCPTDSFAASSVVCRAAIGPCDQAERCTGSAPACPADGVMPSSTVCRPASGACDAVERCDGASVACPPDALAAMGTTCRPAAGACDLAEQCDGTSAACPTDRFATSGVCRPTAGPCDVAESCNGSGPSCPPDGFRSGDVCRSGSGVCDPEERCSGSSASCPPNAYAPNGSNCGATWSELGCGPVNVDYCQSGSCVHRGGYSGSSPSCGTIGATCGFTAQCCGSSGYWCVDEPGNPIYGSSYDCTQCCRRGRCCVDGNPAGPCM